MINLFLNSERRLRNGWWILIFFLGLAALLVPILILAQQNNQAVSIGLQAILVAELFHVPVSYCAEDHWLNCWASLMCAGSGNLA
jgi:hypothetical protein